MAAGSPWAGIDDASQGGEDPSIADRSQLTMRRDSGRSLLRPPADAAPPAPSPSTLAPLLPPPPPAAAPSPPVTAQTPAPVTDPEEALIVACPEMISCRITPEDEFVLLACDGLFDVFSSDEVCFLCVVCVRLIAKKAANRPMSRFLCNLHVVLQFGGGGGRGDQ